MGSLSLRWLLDELPARDVAVKQLSLRVKFQFDFDGLITAVTAHQYLAAKVVAFVVEAQVVAQVDARLNDFAAAMALHGKPIGVVTWGARCEKFG
jgi:hypothetical protein